MFTVILFVKYNGRSDENNVYIANDSLGVLDPINMSYEDLLEILFEDLELNHENYAMWIKYAFELGCALL